MFMLCEFERLFARTLGCALVLVGTVAVASQQARGAVVHVASTCVHEELLGRIVCALLQPVCVQSALTSGLACAEITSTARMPAAATLQATCWLMSETKWPG
jgi:hypothetical protein